MQAAGCPVINTDIRALPEVSTETCGWICKINSFTAEHDLKDTEQSMEFEDNFFDYIIMNYVLEHIPDEKKAISELMRCLKPNGTLLLSFPICINRKTLEDPQIVSPEDRLRYYGQEDHCRLYGTDALEHLKSYGLSVTPYMVKKILPEKEIRRMNLIPDDIIYFCQK